MTDVTVDHSRSLPPTHDRGLGVNNSPPGAIMDLQIYIDGTYTFKLVTIKLLYVYRLVGPPDLIRERETRRGPRGRFRSCRGMVRVGGYFSHVEAQRQLPWRYLRCFDEEEGMK
ncbi:hypothetical protein B296_00053388 [Ensete ventricosum]|uniref:Uncharacterized protein n=1 Tax=Ensete ventricosum TaxID=4639 RepID=A0A426X756_ENSVE|nr:hypothetical protein B296_00053388 [Ensete ventricosum]